MARIFQYALTGLAIGWLVGLSTSAVVGIVLTSVMGSVAALLAASHGSAATLKGIFSNGKDSAASSVERVAPTSTLTALIAATALGATAGVWARTHDWFAPTDAQIVKHWSDLGLDASVVRQRLFDARFPLGKPIESRATTVLFNVSVEECAELLSLDRSALRKSIEASTNPAIAAMARPGVSDEDLQKAIQVICKRK
jgi:hypothetical protein